MTDRLDLLRRDVPSWNRERERDPSWRPDLKNAKLQGLDLAEADLHQADCTSADLSGAGLQGADLSKAELGRASLRGADLSGADLLGAVVTECDLFSAQLRGANLVGAQLGQSVLQRCVLDGSDLAWADFTRADLTGASLRETTLINATFHRTPLDEADFDGAVLASTLFAGVDLRKARGLDTANYRNPCELTVSTFYLSHGQVPAALLRGAEVPDDFMARVGPLFGHAGEYYSCFISYNHRDREFAHRLCADLQAKGIRAWLDDHQVLPGDYLYEAIDRGIRLWDKVLLCCSRDSLHSRWVDLEVGKALDKEERLWRERGQRVLAIIPLDLDGYLFEWQDGKASALTNRLAPSFSGWREDERKYGQQLDRLLRALRADPGGREAPPPPRL